MVFSSPRFIAFLCVCLAVLALPMQRQRKVHVLGAFSCVFYAAWDVRYLALLLGISLLDYFAAKQIAASPVGSSRRKQFLWVSVVANLGVLAYFKYTNFAFDSAVRALALIGVHVQGRTLDILLPAGVSFYTFKTMSYTIDVYRGEIEPVRSTWGYATFVTFFPELIAGPIVRASVFLPQMDREIGPTRERLLRGLSLFLLGLTKKLIIGDHMASVADPIFASPGIYDSMTVWCGVIAYSIQIYADFSGYSDMAIGCAKMIGYDLPENFNMPYVSRSLTEFWRRWHITLSSWLRDYLYIPLGGNRGSSVATYRNLTLTMLLGGLWHGASWNFILWGAMHGLGLAVHRALSRRSGARPLPAAIALPTTLLFVMLAWVPFRAADFSATKLMWQKMLIWQGGARFESWKLMMVAPPFIALHVFGTWLGERDPRAQSMLDRLGFRRIDDPISGVYVELGAERLIGTYVVGCWILLVYLFGSVGASPFIYFQF